MYTKKGLAEIVREPSPLTMKYLQKWFTGEAAFGTGIAMTGWPVTKANRPVLVWNKKDGLRVDLDAEEEVMYSRTIFGYIPDGDDGKLSVIKNKLVKINCLTGTAKALWSQSKLLSNPQATYDLIRKRILEIPIKTPESLSEIENGLVEVVWPRVVMADYCGEFLFSAWSAEIPEKDKMEKIMNNQKRYKDKDWYTQSMLAYSTYKDGGISKESFILDYGLCSGDDYELTKPRYYEILKAKKPTYEELPIEEAKITNLEDLVARMQYLRSEAKRRSLIWIAELREKIK